MELEKYEEKFYANLSYGKSRRDGIRRALDVALEINDIESALSLYYIFIEEDYFECDGFQAMLAFPEYLALFEQHPELHPEYQERLMWAYKWTVGGMHTYYQIPMEQITTLFKHYDELCTQFGYNKRSFYRQIWNLMYDHDIDEFIGVSSVEEAHREMMKCSLDDLSENPAGECDDAVKYALFVEKDIDKALKTAEPILSGELTCNVVPHYTYTNFAWFYFKNGDINNAKEYVKKAYRVLNWDFGNSNALIYYKGLCIIVMSYVDLPKAYKMFKNHFNVCKLNKCGYDMFPFYLGGYHLMSQLEKSGEQIITLGIVDQSEPIYNDKGRYSIAEMKSWLYSKAKFYADKFDERNANDKYNRELSQRYDFN